MDQENQNKKNKRKRLDPIVLGLVAVCVVLIVAFQVQGVVSTLGVVEVNEQPTPAPALTPFISDPVTNEDDLPTFTPAPTETQVP